MSSPANSLSTQSRNFRFSRGGFGEHATVPRMERGFFITLRAIRRQIAAMPNEFYLVRLIHSVTRCSCPGERLWTANQLSQAAVVSFLDYSTLAYTFFRGEPAQIGHIRASMT